MEKAVAVAREAANAQGSEAAEATLRYDDTDELLLSTEGEECRRGEGAFRRQSCWCISGWRSF